MSQPILEEKLEQLIQTQNLLIDKLEVPKRKDRWDKLSIITTFVASVLVVTIGGIYTAMYRATEDQRQRDQKEIENNRILEESKRLTFVQAHEGRIKELEVISKVLPYLEKSQDENQQVAAFRLIQVLASKEIAEQLAFLKPSRSALVFVDQSAQAIINSPNSSAKDIQEAKQHFENTISQLIDAQPYYDESADRNDVTAYYEGVDINSVTQSDALMILHELITQTHVSLGSYKTARYDLLYPIIDRRPDGSLRSIYGNQVLATSASLAKTTDVPLFNTESVVPKSWFGGRNPMKTDIHNMFACDRKCNAFRGANKYGNIVSESASSSMTDCGKRSTNYFEPSHGKGTVARAMLYFLVRYPGVLGDSDRELQHYHLQQLIEWHKEEPPGIYEKHRNAMIYLVQGNRNPFIDFPSWVDRINYEKAFARP